MSAAVEYDLGGVVGIRLADAGPDEEALVSRQLGPIRRPLEREPDIVVRFVEELELSSPVRYIGLDDCGFTQDAFLVLRGKHKSRARVQIPFARIGGRCEIVCERGLAAVPLLVPIVNLTALANGLLPLHAAAFLWNDVGIVATGWSKGGKTETLLAFMANGARYVGDEWVYFTRDGERMFGIPEPIRVWNWHLESMPGYRARLSRKDRARLSMLSWVEGSMNRLTAGGARHRSAATRTMNRLSSLMRNELCVDLPPEKLFGGAVDGVAGARPRKFFLVVSHERPEITVRAIDPAEIAGRMLHSLDEEGARLRSAYAKFRYAFPSQTNTILERAGELNRQALESILRGKEAYEVLHPYPVALPDLFTAVEPFCG